MEVGREGVRYTKEGILRDSAPSLPSPPLRGKEKLRCSPRSIDSWPTPSLLPGVNGPWIFHLSSRERGRVSPIPSKMAAAESIQYTSPSYFAFYEIQLKGNILVDTLSFPLLRTLIYLLVAFP